MLSVQSVKPMTFRGSAATADYPIYSKEQYMNDKSKLEEHLDEINSVMEDVEVPKPLRIFGRLIKVGIGAAIGFIGMKFGTQGIIKYGRKALEAAKNFVKKPKIQNASNFVKEKFVGVKQKVVDFLKNNKLVQKVVSFVKEKLAVFKGTKFGTKVSDVAKDVKESKFMAKATNLKNSAKESLKKFVTAPADGVSPLEKGTVNLFAVSGGVSGAITGLQETAGE